MKKKYIIIFVCTCFSLRAMTNSGETTQWVIEVESMDDRLENKNNNNGFQDNISVSQENNDSVENSEKFNDDFGILARRALLISEGKRNKRIESILRGVLARYSSRSVKKFDRHTLLRQDSLNILRSYKQVSRLSRSYLSGISEEYDSPEKHTEELQKSVDEDNKTKITSWINNELCREIQRHKKESKERCSRFSTLCYATLTSVISLAPFIWVRLTQTCR